MLSIARSRLALAVQLVFLGLHAFATLFGTVYQTKTPDLYVKNSHRPVGWIVTLIVLAQALMETIIMASRKSGNATIGRKLAVLSFRSLRQNESEHQDNFIPPAPSRSQSVSSTETCIHEEEQRLYQHDTLDESSEDEKQEFLPKRSSKSGQAVDRTIKVLLLIHNIINRTILLSGFVAFLTGAAVYGGVFVSLDNPRKTAQS